MLELGTKGVSWKDDVRQTLGVEITKDMGNGKVWAVGMDVAQVGWRTRSLEGSCSRNWEARVLEYFQIRRLECRTLAFDLPYKKPGNCHSVLTTNRKLKN